MALSMFYPSVTGMEAHSHAMSTVSTNIANINTVGYKKQETLFQTMLGSQPVVKGGGNTGLSSSRTDISGVTAYDRTYVTSMGTIQSTGQTFDVAIQNTGNAFFLVQDSGGYSYYTRAGNFETRTVDGTTYLVTSNGYNVQGFKANEDGTFSANPESITIDPQAVMPSNPTSKMDVIANVAANEASNIYGLTVYGPNNDGKNMNMTFTKVEGKTNTWSVDFAMEDGGTVTGGPIEVVFDSQGAVVSPKTLDINVQWSEEAGGGSNSVSIDISKMTQYDGSNQLTNVWQDGYPSGTFVSCYFDDDGVLKATYTNERTVNLAKLTLVGFEAPDNLYSVSNTMFQANADCGESYYLDGNGMIEPEALESSTANVEEDFSKMIVVQRAYSVNASAFTTTDEMLQLLVDLKT